MDLNEIFQGQIQSANPLTQEQFDQLASTEDYFGTQFEVGEYQLFAMFAEFVPEELRSEDFPNEIAIQMAKLSTRSQEQLEENYIYTDQTTTPNGLDFPRFVNKQLVDKEDGGKGEN